MASNIRTLVVNFILDEVLPADVANELAENYDVYSDAGYTEIINSLSDDEIDRVYDFLSLINEAA